MTRYIFYCFALLIVLMIIYLILTRGLEISIGPSKGGSRIHLDSHVEHHTTSIDRHIEVHDDHTENISDSAVLKKESSLVAGSEEGEVRGGNPGDQMVESGRENHMDEHSR